MKLSKVLFLTVAFTLSSAAFAEGGADRVFDRMMEAQQAALSKKANSQVISAASEEAENTKGGC